MGGPDSCPISSSISSVRGVSECKIHHQSSSWISHAVLPPGGGLGAAQAAVSGLLDTLEECRIVVPVEMKLACETERRKKAGLCTSAAFHPSRSHSVALKYKCATVMPLDPEDSKFSVA